MKLTMKRIVFVLVFVLVFALLLSPASLAESSHANDFFSGLSQAWGGLVGMASDAGQAVSDFANESGVTQWVNGAVNSVSTWFQGSGLAEWAEDASASLSAWFENAGVWTEEAASNLQSFIDENGPAVEAWLAQAGKEVQAAWETLTSSDDHTKEEIQEAYETVVEALKEASDPLSELAGLQWSFSSGAGGWSTELQTTAGGSFSGQYHDSEMGEAAEDYPNGTVYCCSFKGHMSFVEYVDSHTWKIRVDSLIIDDASEAIDDGIRFVPTEPYGISASDEMLLFLPGTPVDALTEDMRMWAHLLGENVPDALEDWFLYSEKNNSGFVGYKV